MKFLPKYTATEVTYEVSAGGFAPSHGSIHRIGAGGYMFSSNHRRNINYFGSNELRLIADFVDALNAVKGFEDREF